MQAPTRARHKMQTSAQRLEGMLEIFVIGSMRSTQPMLTSGIHRAQETCAQCLPDFVDFIAPPLFGHSTQSGLIPIEHVRQSHCPNQKYVKCN